MMRFKQHIKQRVIPAAGAQHLGTAGIHMCANIGFHAFPGFCSCNILKIFRMTNGVTLFLVILFCLSGCLSSQSPAPYVHYGIEPAAGSASSAGVHIVNAGDSLWTLSNRYKVSMQDLVYVNNLTPPYRLEIGNRLTLPPPNTYTVRYADSLYTISKTFDISISDLARQNDLTAPYTIHPGDQLHLPSARPNVSVPGAKPSSTPSTQSAAAVQTASVQKTPPIPAEKVQRAKKITAAKVPARSSSKFGWPVDGRVVSNYGPKKGGFYNKGINIAAPRGAPVRAAENGVIVYADNQLEGYGNLVLVRHSDRYMTAYAHLDKTLIKRGQVIKRGQTLGTVGSTGSVSSPQLHFEIRRGTDAINPKRYLSAAGS